jgi:SAM-dependent methyltransferase
MTYAVERFSNRVANYVKYRPHYPREVIGHLESKCGLTHETIIADIGCGTGISSQLFLENCNHVIGVEPNAAMREAAAEFLADFPAFSLVAGTAELTTLDDLSVDMVIAATAFHWFDPVATRHECLRILRPGGHIVLIWNERQLNTTPFLEGYDVFLRKYANNGENARHGRFDYTKLSDFFGSEYGSATFGNSQIFDFEGLRGRVLSSSYMPTETDDVYHEMNGELQALFAKHAENGRIKVLYDTNVFYSQV